MIYYSGREAYDKELKQHGFTREESQNIYSKIGDFFVVLYSESELKRLKEAKDKNNEQV